MVERAAALAQADKSGAASSVPAGTASTEAARTATPPIGHSIELLLLQPRPVEPQIRPSNASDSYKLSAPGSD